MTLKEARKIVKDCSDRKKEIKQCMKDIAILEKSY